MQRPELRRRTTPPRLSARAALQMVGHEIGVDRKKHDELVREVEALRRRLDALERERQLSPLRAVGE
jgi:polyhydroxyalkanoate synthesis regulator phasin